MQQQGVEVKAKGLGDGIDSLSVDIKLDATAGRAVAMLRGAGRIRHTATPTLWLQRLVINGDIKMTRVGGNDNCADLGTKHLDYQTMNKHMKFCGMRFAEGWSKIAPQLEFFSTSIPMSNETSGSPHSGMIKGLSWVWRTWYGDTRRTVRIATWLGQQRRKEV